MEVVWSQASRGGACNTAPGSNPNQRYSPMAQADSNNSTTALAVPSRRLFLSHAAGLAAGGTVLALAVVSPTPAAAALPTDLALSAAKASPALRTAVAALNESFDRLEAAKAVFAADDLKMVEWSELHPRSEEHTSELQSRSDLVRR